MKVDLEKIEKNKVLLKVEVSTKDVMEAIKKAYKDISQNVNIPGFRKGHVPESIIDSNIGLETVYNEALKEMLPRSYVKAVENSGIEPIDKPDIDVKQMEKGKPLRFEATVEIKPEVKIGEYEQVEVTQMPIEVTEEEVNEHLIKLQNRFAQLEVVEEERPLKKGDFALIDFKGFIGEKPYKQGSATDYLLELGSQTFMPGFEDQLVGAKKGEIIDVHITFPKDYPLSEAAGEDVRFNVLIKEIKRKVLPELSDEFAKEAGEFETLKDLKSDLNGKLEESKRYKSDLNLRRDLLNKITEQAEVEIPDTMKRQRTDELLAQFTQNLRNQGTDIESYLQATKTEFETLKKSLEEEALATLKNELVLDAIAKAEKIKVSDEEVEEEIESYAKIMGKGVAEVKNLIEKRGTIWVLKDDLVKRRTMDWLVEHAKIIEEKPQKKENRKTPEKKEKKRKPKATQKEKKIPSGEKKKPENES